MGGSLTGPNKIKDVYKKIVFYDDNKLKIDNKKCIAISYPDFEKHLNYLLQE